MLARLTQQMDVVTKWLRNVTPRAARASMCGVLTTGLPVQPRPSQRRSSARRKRMLGGRSAAGAGVTAKVAARRQTTRFIGASPPLRALDAPDAGVEIPVGPAAGQAVEELD